MLKKVLRMEYLGGLLALAIAVVINFPMTVNKIFLLTKGDYWLHLSFVENLLNNQPIPDFTSAHPLWQYGVIVLARLFHLSSSNAAVLFQMIASTLFALLVYEAFLRTGLPWYGAVLFSAVLNLVTPLSIYVLQDTFYYLGYIGITSYHNPTIIWLKPLSLVVFFAGTNLLAGKQSTWLKVLLIAVLMFLSTWLKPSYTICLLPVVCVIALYRIIKKKLVDWKMLIGGFVIPSVLLLAWQFITTYAASDEAEVIFAPFAVMSAYSNHLLFKFILSIWFPLWVTLFWWKEIQKENNFLLAWVVFGAGAFYTYFLAESGPRFLHGNFGWSGEITNVILFVSASLFFAKQLTHKWPWKWKEILILGAAFLPHVAFGIAYYLYCMRVDSFL